MSLENPEKDIGFAEIYIFVGKDDTAMWAPPESFAFSRGGSEHELH